MQVFRILAVAGAVALLAGGCVSSKRAMRVSPLAKEVEVSFDQEAVNLWPFYFNAGGSGAILWPLADFDAQGFAVRPFYVQDGRERSVLFPLSAWNDRSGWALNGYWTERNFGMWPLFHHGPGGGYCLLGWRSPESWGVFPLARFGARGGYAGPVWWKSGENGARAYGVFPVWCHTPDFRMAGLFYRTLYGDNTESWGVFPLLHSSEEWNHIGPAWWKPENSSWGVFPLAWITPDFSLAGPVYWNRENGETVSGGLFPLAYLSKEWNYAGPVVWRYGDDRRSRAFGVLPLCWRYQDFRLVGPVWWEKSDWGVLPLFWKVGDENMLFPFYYYWHNGENFKFNLLGPVGGVKRRSSRPGWDWHFLWPLLEKDGDSFGVWPLFSDNRRPGGGVLPSPLFSRREERRSGGYTLPEHIYRRGGGSEVELESVKYTAGMLLGSRSTTRVQVWKDEADRETLEKLPVLLSEQPDGKKDAGAYETWKQEAAALLEKLRLEGPVPEDWKARQALFQEMARRFCTERERVEGKALLGLLWNYSRQEGEFESRWLLGLIARDRGDENIRDLNVLGGLYRERSRDGLTEYSIFPFISRLEGPGRSRWSFCAGMFRHETDGGRSGGAVFFIPYGDL